MNSVAHPSPVATEAVPSSVIAMVGNPNVGKTSLFNRLTNLLAKTSNFPGTTVERRMGRIDLGNSSYGLVDLPGLYSLDAQSPDERVACDYLRGETAGDSRPNRMLIVVDATNLERSLFIAKQALALSIPAVVAVNLIDVAAKRKLRVDCEKLSTVLECPVIPVSARTGEGLSELRAALVALRPASKLPLLMEDSCDSCSTCPYADGYRWAATLARESTHSGKLVSQATTEVADRWLTHRIIGPLLFAVVMLAVFTTVFWIAQYPMELLDAGFASLAVLIESILPPGDLSDLLTEGVIGGVGSVLLFIPQICLLFFMLAILEDSGYLSRAVVVVDRYMRRVGLPGQAFVPLLAAHACAIPAIMSTRVIENRRDRLAAILVIPLMTCSARLPVYSMVAAMLFPDQPIRAALLFASGYALGMIAAFGMAWVLKRTILPGAPSYLILDLPPYRAPSLGNAVRQALDRGWAFLRDAGTVILLISVVIWALSTYPKLPEETFQQRLANYTVELQSTPQSAESAVLPASFDVSVYRAEIAQEYSILGRCGKWVQPLFEPLGFDWRTSVGVLASFAAREVVVSTLSVLYGAGDDSNSFLTKITTAQRRDGSRLFDTPTAVSLLVFFVLAMQCLPTQAVTRKETGSWKWAAFQFAYMSCLAYVGAFIARQICLLL